jgi:hypothetical protein
MTLTSEPVPDQRPLMGWQFPTASPPVEDRFPTGGGPLPHRWRTASPPVENRFPTGENHFPAFMDENFARSLARLCSLVSTGIYDLDGLQTRRH